MTALRHPVAVRRTPRPLFLIPYDVSESSE